jgi:hypothetical protein
MTILFYGCRHHQKVFFTGLYYRYIVNYDICNEKQFLEFITDE